MTRYVALLRGVNVSGRNMIAMPLLREIAEAAGFTEVSTYLQSGNLFLTTPLAEAKVATVLRAAIGDRTGLDLPVIVRTHDELVRVVDDNPLVEPADPKRFYVTFLAEPVTDLGLAVDGWGEDRVAVSGREIYSWYAEGMHASKLASALARTGGKSGTARNWRTVQALVAETS